MRGHRTLRSDGTYISIGYLSLHTHPTLKENDNRVTLMLYNITRERFTNVLQTGPSRLNTFKVALKTQRGKQGQGIAPNMIALIKRLFEASRGVEVIEIMQCLPVAPHQNRNSHRLDDYN